MIERLRNWFKRVDRAVEGDRWMGCQVPTPAERLARWEVELGKARAAERLRAERVSQCLDLVAAQRARQPMKAIPFPKDRAKPQLKIVKSK